MRCTRWLNSAGTNVSKDKIACLRSASGLRCGWTLKSENSYYVRVQAVVVVYFEHSLVDPCLNILGQASLAGTKVHTQGPDIRKKCLCEKKSTDMHVFDLLEQSISGGRISLSQTVWR